ncbi:Amino acid permease family protein [Trichomonas vaginalis G3]|uniref:Amino acid permease family protein n=1 Tax=Trichomonas vaginalis (strain ATCC PRA-98 / G3) TaxID=412133 RepID=A2FMM0_TRIV3|nr:solute carrier family 12, cation cotransporters family [Trichomonas vaginalis G3]EAX93858.1 Amino acid permease family protein [Trichomonas vaginalis G3]KAI5528416.1 solute carrier family 12, cation cotransporters family [Trichomonas vaginalis G3]|eukprot:XP_001306788.1 Amino acid permease family protein [Trichomonas vaginalis G3]
MISEYDNENNVQLQDLAQPSAIDTYEHLPSTIFYRSFGMKRASPIDIRSNSDALERPQVVEQEKKKMGGSYGTFDGVFLRCVLNILSVVYYLRLGWVVGNCGLLLSFLMIIVSGLATTLTTLSLSAIVTNGRVKGGGVYFCISRSLGPDFGGTIGVVFSIATIFTGVLNTFGFVEVVKDIIGKDITKDGKWDIPIIGISLVTFLVILICISLVFEAYLQYILAVVIALSIITILIGFAIPGKPKWIVTNLKNNLYPKFQEGNTFWTIFAVFFPACTGIMAGANISGDLKEPQKSIPIGTLGAIGFTTLLYLVTATIVASAADRETLWSDFSLLSRICAWKWFIYIGVLAASFSSTSSAMVGGPKLFQALCRDDILPKFFKFFAKGKAKTDDPIRGFILGWIIIVITTFIFKDLNAVGPIVSSLFLISYGVTSFTALVGRLSHAPSWRPAWKYYHPVTAILGAAMCIIAMFLINWVIALVTIGIVLIIFGYFHWKDRPSADWGEFPQAMLFTDTVRRVAKLQEISPHVKNYRPVVEFLVFRDGTEERQIRNVLPFADACEQATSLLYISSCAITSKDTPDLENETCYDATIVYRRWEDLEIQKIPPLIVGTGLGKLCPNVVATTINANFISNPASFDFVGAAFDANLGVALARNFESVDASLEHTWPIDVWWLSDDGGLVLLLGYLIQKKKSWEKCQLRVLTAAPRNDGLSDVQVRVSKLLQLFRIDAEVIVIPGIDDKPGDDTINMWNERGIEEGDENQKRKVQTFLRLRELILDNSAHSSMVLCSMPIPRATQDAKVWLGTIDIVSDSMPPFIWVHGNGENVVTFLT